MPNFSANEIALCRRLHELGVRPQIREGDWLVYLPAAGNTPILAHYGLRENIRESYGYLWSWECAREWLGERGWLILSGRGLCDHWDGEISITFFRDKNIEGKGQTDLEAILSVCVQVAEGEKE